MILLSEKFERYNGISSSNVEIFDDKINNNYLPYLRPSKQLFNTIAGYVDKCKIDKKYVFPSETIFVSTDGQGSHTYSYVAPFEFIPNSNVVALVPKEELSLIEKIFYAHCITKNRYKFSYGRKPKSDRLDKLLIPASLPKWVYQLDFSERVRNELNYLGV
jgi:hypothetical protein